MTHRLERLLRPRSIAVFGGVQAAAVVKQSLKMGFAGDIWPVHPTKDEVAGVKAYRSAAELMIMEAGWKYDQGTVTDQDMAMAKLKATEMLAFVADEAIQIHGGMGLMDDLPLERIWRDARVERIWEGTSEIQRHIISRALLRAVGG